MNQEISILDILKVLARRWWIIVLSVAVLGTGAFVYTKYFVTPIYTSRSMLYVDNASERVQQKDELNINTINASEKLVSTYMEILKSDSYITEVAVKSNLYYPPKKIKAALSMSAINGTQMLEIKVSDPNPENAQKINMTLVNGAQAEVSRIVQAGSVEVVDGASLPDTPSSPNMRANLLFGILMGLIVGGLIVWLIELFNVKIKNEADLAGRFAYPVLGVVPNVSGTKY